MKPHYLGAVYELTQENMQHLIKQLDDFMGYNKVAYDTGWQKGWKNAIVPWQARVEVLEAEIAELKRLMPLDLITLNDKIQELKTEIADKTEALEFYSEKSNYSLIDEGRNYNVEYKCYELDENYSDVELGTKARQVLAKYKGDK